jgi:hypothetical protein
MGSFVKNLRGFQKGWATCPVQPNLEKGQKEFLEVLMRPPLSEKKLGKMSQKLEPRT